MTLQHEAAFTLLAPHAKRLRFSIKWQSGVSVARIIGAPKVPPFEMARWWWEGQTKAKYARPGYISCPIREVTRYHLATLSLEGFELLLRLQKLAKP